MNNPFNIPSDSSVYGFGIIVLTIWSLIWKGLALWRSSRKGDKYWFIAILVINTLGLLEIVYLLFFHKKGAGKPKKKAGPQK